jgi:serine/threonine protein kinase
MQLTIAQIWERIHSAGIATPEQCRQWAKSVSEAIGPTASSDPALVIKELVQQDKLSPYQANVLYRGLPHPLQLGKLRVVRSLESERGACWYEGEDASGARWSAFPPKAVWMVALPDERLATPEIQDWPPSLLWAQQHCQVQSPHLDRWMSAGATLKHLYAVCESVPGLLLSEMLEQGPLSSTQAHRMLRDVAMGLKLLHLHRLTHGHLSTHSIVWSEMRGFLLLRDPIYPPRSPYHAPSLSVLGGLDQRLALAAPELILPTALPNVQSDLYALGCLWFRSLTGNWPIDPGPDAPPELWAKLHANVPVVLPSKLPEVQKKCLMHLLAKDPSVRFSGVDPLLRALDQLVLPNETEALASPATLEPEKPAPQARPAPEAKPALQAKPETQAKPALQAKRSPETKPAPLVDPVLPVDPSTIAQPAKSQTTPSSDSKALPGALPGPLPTGPLPTGPLPTGPVPTGPVQASANKPTSTQVATAPKKSPKKKKTPPKPFGPRKKTKRPAWFLPLVVACSLLALMVLSLLLRGNQRGLVEIKPPAVKTAEDQQTSDIRTTLANSNKPTAGGIDPLLEYYNVKTDDSGVPWTPPTIGAPLSTEMLPAGIEALLVLSGECWNQTGTTSKELADWWRSLYPQSSDLSGFPALLTDGLASASFAWYPGEATGKYRQVQRWVWKEPKALETLLPQIGQWESNEIQSDNKKYRYWTSENQGKTIALITDDFTTKADQQVKRIAVGPWELLKPLLESQGKSGPLRRQLEGLLQTTDSRAEVSFLAAPSFLFVDGKELFGEHSEKVLGVMREVIDDRIQGVLVRTHFEPNLYLEYRMIGNDLQSAPRDAVELKRKLDALAEGIESQLAAQPAAAYWRAIANRFPQMLRSVNKYARSGAEDGQVVFNAYLPKEAASNLAIGSWMALQGLAASGPTKVATAPKPTTNAAKTVEEMLDAKISLRIEQESLEVVLQAIANELKDSHTQGTETLPMAINGTAFQKDGITRNQQIRNFEYKDTSVREVLTALSRRANPVTTVQSPNEKDQKVVWLVLEDPATPSKKKIDMTTRAWSESNQAPLPKEFQVPAE